MVLTIGCQICKENFSSIAIFKTHLNTRLHNQMFSQVFLNASVGYNVPFTGFPNIVFVTQSSRRQTRKRPILGLSYITLCFSHTCPGAFYLCHICQETCPLGKILHHVFGIEHISSYFAYTDPDALSFAWIASMIFITEKSRAIAEQKKDNFNLQLLHLSENLLTQCQNENYSTVMNLLHQNKNLSNLLSVYDANIPQIKSLLSYRDDVKRQNPLLGLQHLVECVCPGPNEKKHYICTLCSTHASPKNIIKHVLSFAHVYKYFKAWHPSTPMPNESYTKYNTKFKSRMLHFAKQSEAIYGTAGVQQVTLQPADFTAVPHSSIEIAIKMIEIVTKKKEGSLIPVVKPGPKLEPNKSRKEVTLSNKPAPSTSGHTIPQNQNVKPENKTGKSHPDALLKPSSSEVTNLPLTLNAQPQIMPEEPAAQVMPYSLYCQNCSRKFDTDTLYSNHLSMSRHQEMYYIVFGGDANDSSSQSNKSLALLSIPCFGASLIVTILSHHLRDQQFYICFACETCIYSPGLLHHIHSKKHFIRVLMYQNPWRLPFGWKNGLDYHSLKRQVYEEEEQRGPEQKTMKILDVPAHIFKNVLNLDFPKVIEQFNLYHTQLLNAVPHCETFSKLKDNERFPLLGRDFLVKYGHMKTGWKFLCLLCERTLSADEYNGHVFSWEHVVAFLENVHPGSLDTNIANEETLLDLAKQAARIHRVLNEQEIIMFQGSFVHVSDYLTKIRQLSNEKARDGNGPLKPTITPQMKLVPRQKDATMNNLPAQGETAEKLDIADQENAKETEITTEVSDGQTEEALEICLQEESEEPMLNIAIEQEVDGLNPQPECSVEGVTYHENTKTPDGQNVEPMESCLQEKSDHQVQQVTFKQEVDGSNPVAGPVVVVNDNEKNNNDGESMDNKALKRPCSMLEEDHSTSETGEADPKRMRLSEPEEKDKLVNNQNRDAIGDCSLGDQAETNTVPSSCPEKLWMYVQSKIREPLIGLNALYECCCDDQAPVYLCECCRLIIKEEQIITHLNNHWHYRNYLQSVKADSLTQDKNWREKIVKFAAYWERTEGYGDPQAVELTTEDYVKISAGFEWYKAFQIVRAQMAKDENIKNTNLDVNNVGTAAEESQDERQQCAKLEMDLEPQISPDPATTTENTEAISNPDVKTEQHADINLAKVEEPMDSDVTKSSEALTELVCSPHNLVTNTLTTPTITTPALSSSIQSTVNPEVAFETASMVQEDPDLKIENIIPLSCPTDAMDTPKPSEPVCKFVKLTRTVPSFAITQPTPPPIPTSIPASSCTSVVVSNAISPDSSKAEDYTSISSILKTTEDAAKSQVCVFTMGSKVQSHLSKPQEESNVIFESTAAVPCEDKMSAIKLTTVPSETIMALSVVNGDAIISTKPTKNNNQLKLKVDVASNNPQEEGNDKFTPSTPNCELQMTELPQKSTAGSKIAGQDGESNVTTEKNKPATTECALHSNKKPTPKPPQRTTQCPKIGSDQLIKVSCEGRWQFYCFACQTSVESTNHLISASHQMNCVKIKFPWWTTNPPLNDMVALMADDEKALKPVPKKIEVSSEVYKELKALKGLKAVERIRGMEKHKSGSKNAVNPRPLVSENEEPRSSPSEISLSPYQATSPVLAGQDKSETKSREETSVETIKKRPVLSESAPKTSSKTQKPASKVPPRITGAITGNSSNLSKFLKVRAIDKPVIGLCLIWECRVVSQGPPKTFYLCESCSKTLTVSEIMEHMPSTEHQWNYMIKQYPRFMYWKDEELLPEMSAELTNSIAGWVSGREESMDAQAVLLSEDYYERVRTASFVEALNFLHMIRESKKATLPLFDVEGELGEDQTLDSLKNPVTDGEM